MLDVGYVTRHGESVSPAMGMGLWEHQPAENNRQKDTSEEQEIAPHRTDDF